MKLIKTLITIALLPFISCSSKSPEETAADPDAAIVLSVDGKTRTISADSREADVINFDEHPIKTLFRTKGENRQFEINLNFYEPEILEKIPITYTLPRDHPGTTVKIDLNFFDFEREVEKSLHRRLVFDKGTITIHELSGDKIHFDFEGQVYELMNPEKRSDVSGSVDVEY